MGNKKQRCLIISGAPEKELSYIKPYIDSSFIIAADSGYLKCNELNIIPDLIIGDFDSAKKPQMNCEIIELPTVKDDTDTFHSVKEAISRGYKDIIIVGGVGNRFDHSYANVLSIIYGKKNNSAIQIISEKCKILLCDKKCRINKNNGYRFFSLFAVGNEVKNLNISGAKYNLNGYNLSAYDNLCQSNEITEDAAEISYDSGYLLLILADD